MAIKGKRRSRGGRARVAAPPRPVFVEPKKPLFRRLWFRTLLGAVLIGLMATAGFFFWQERQAAAEAEEAREDVARLGVHIEGALLGVAQQLGGQLIVLPEMGEALVQIQSGEARERRVRRQAEGWEEALRETDQSLAAIETDRGQIRQAIARLREGLGQFIALAGDIPEILDADDEDERRELAVELATRHQEASATISNGWLIYQGVRAEVGLEQQAPEMDPNVPPGFPGIPPEGLDPELLPDDVGSEPSAEE